LTTYKVFASDRFVEARSVYFGTFDNPYYARFAVPPGTEGQAYTEGEDGELTHYAYSYQDVIFGESVPNSRWIFCGWEQPDGQREFMYQRLETRTVANPDKWTFRMATGSNFGHVEDPF
jgi:hypothetical protein